MKYQILRLNLAGYQDSRFLKREKAFLEEKLPVKVILETKQIGPEPLVLITNTHSDLKKLSPALLSQTQLMIHPNSGFDNFSTNFVKKVKFPIILGNPIRAQAVSEYVISTLFQHFCPIPSHQKWQRNFPRNLLQEENILIVGFGHVGKILKKSLKALGLKVQVYDPFKQKKQKGKSSVLIVAASLNSTSKNLINKNFMEKYLTEDFVLINPARGEIVQEQDLLRHLKNHPKSYAYLDVFCQEPNDFKSFKLKNLNCTSHIAGIFQDIDQRILDFETRVLYDFIIKYKENPKRFFKVYQDLLLKNRFQQKVNDLI